MMSRLKAFLNFITGMRNYKFPGEVPYNMSKLKQETTAGGGGAADTEGSSGGDAWGYGGGLRLFYGTETPPAQESKDEKD